MKLNDYGIGLTWWKVFIPTFAPFIIIITTVISESVISKYNGQPSDTSNYAATTLPLGRIYFF